ncbi:MAG: alpha-1,2-fucosyltransferase [Lachnospiraceae bacterium]|nr:alpha-1,2-fucosyltransferase [Lachnospiraceae bacterium]
MIIVKCQGGLGNQMLQYIFYLYLKNTVKPEVKIDISGFRFHGAHQGYELEKVFGIRPQYCTWLDKVRELGIDGIELHPKLVGPSHWRKQRDRLVRKGKCLRFSTFDAYNYMQTQMIMDHLYIDGYFLNHEFFDAVQEKAQKAFTFQKKLDGRNQEIAEKLRAEKVVGIHVRLGDYTNDDKWNVCDKEYYTRAIAYCRERLGDIKLYVFSDEDASQVLPEEYSYEYVTWNQGENAYIDMQLMAMCSNLIIANSTFSYLGALLNTNTGKIVIAPAHYNKNEPRPLAGKEWITL